MLSIGLPGFPFQKLIHEDQLVLRANRMLQNKIRKANQVKKFLPARICRENLPGPFRFDPTGQKDPVYPGRSPSAGGYLGLEIPGRSPE